MIQIYKAEVSLNGRDHIVDVLDVDYKVKKKALNTVREAIANSLSVDYEEEVHIYLHYREVEK